MRGFVSIDRQPDSSSLAVWFTCRLTESRVAHGNAVVIDTSGDQEILKKVRSLTRDAVVVVTAGSDLGGLPINGDPLMAQDLEGLLDEAEAWQQRIVSAVDAYARRPDARTGRVPKSPRKLVRPTFAPRPKVQNFVPAADSSAQRALATANFVARAWAFWLEAEEARLKRTIGPRGESPWMMPEELNSSGVALLPAGFAASVRVQALV